MKYPNNSKAAYKNKKNGGLHALQNIKSEIFAM
jgi:hypothetical protein